MRKETELKEYLEDLKDLESKNYTQTNILNNINNEIKDLVLDEENLREPHKPQKEASFLATFIAMFFTVSLPLVPVMLIVGFFLNLGGNSWTSVLSYLFTFPTLVAVVITIISSISNKKKDKESQKDYELDLKRYLHDVEAEKERVIINNKKNQYLRIQYHELYSIYDSTKKAVENLYNINWIFPKYRNMTAITQISEYFASGRCNELEGPNGAYNLYESELRMNLIIDKMNLIVDNLEQIKRNQFMLYEEFCRSNQIAEQILGSINYACDKLDDISINTFVTSYNTKIIKSNTDTMNKYL